VRVSARRAEEVLYGLRAGGRREVLRELRHSRTGLS
jgi:hypothetical protein